MHACTHSPRVTLLSKLSNSLLSSLFCQLVSDIYPLRSILTNEYMYVHEGENNTTLLSFDKGKMTARAVYAVKNTTWVVWGQLAGPKFSLATG